MLQMNNRPSVAENLNLRTGLEYSDHACLLQA
jgi:hypothetical protein